MTLLWQANYGAGAVGDWETVGFGNCQYQPDGGSIVNSYNGPKLVSDTHPLLGRCLKHTLDPADYRCECTPPNAVNSFGEGDDVFFRFDFVLGADFDIATSTWFHLITQVHSASLTASPVIEFDIRNGGLYLRGSSETQTSLMNTRLATVSAGVAYSVIFRVRFSFNQADSYIQTWVNGNLVYDQVPPLAMLNAGGDSYLKTAGEYRATAFEITETHWSSNHAIGTTYADVATLANGNSTAPVITHQRTITDRAGAADSVTRSGGSAAPNVPAGTLVTLGGQMSAGHLADFWSRFSQWVQADPVRSATVVMYGLQNEPHDLPGGAATWEQASQAALDAIRATGDGRLIAVSGYNWSSLTEWANSHPDGWIVDPGQAFVYEAHHYWDTQTAPSLGPRSGQFQQPAPGGGVQTLTYATELAAAVQQTAGSASARSGTRATAAPMLAAPGSAAARSGSVATARSTMDIPAAPSSAVAGSRATLSGSTTGTLTIEATSGTTAALAPSVLVDDPQRIISATRATTDPILSSSLFASAVSGSAAILLAPGVIPPSAGEVISATVATVSEQLETWTTASAVSGTQAQAEGLRESAVTTSAVSGTSATAAPFYTLPAAGSAVSGSRATAAQPNLEMAVIALALSGVRAELAASWASGQIGAQAYSGSRATAGPQLTARASAAVVSGSRAQSGIPALTMRVAGTIVAGSRAEAAGTVGFTVSPLAVVSGTRATALGVTVKIGAAALVSGTVVTGSITLGYTGPPLVGLSGSLALATAATPITPVFVRPRGVVRERDLRPTMQLLVVETISGRVITRLPFDTIAGSAPLNKQTTCSATLVLEESLDALSDQRFNDPRSALHAILVGEWRFSLVPCYGSQPLVGGPLQPSEDISGGRVAVGAVGMERMLERRILHNHNGTGKLADASRDIWFSQTNTRSAMYRLVQEAIKPYGRNSRKLPIIASEVPDAWGLRSFSWPAYDLVNVWKALTDLSADVDGPDFRLDPVLIDTDDGPFVYWDLQLGDPALPASGNIGPDGPTPWTLSPTRDEISRSLDAAEMANRVFGTGQGQDRNKTIQLATNNTPALMGWPDLEITDSVTNADASSAEVAADDTDAVSRQASSMVSALSTATNKVKVKIANDGWPGIGLVRRGDLARIDTRASIYLDPGFELRRITQVDWSGDGFATLSCESDDDLVGV